MNKTDNAGRKPGQSTSKKFVQLSQDVLFGDIWERTQLSARERSLVTVAALVALYRLEQLPFHLQRALDNGLSSGELEEVMTHLAFYSGWPTAASALNILGEVDCGISV